MLPQRDRIKAGFKAIGQKLVEVRRAGDRVADRLVAVRRHRDRIPRPPHVAVRRDDRVVPTATVRAAIVPAAIVQVQAG